MEPSNIFCFWLRREDQQKPIIKQLLYQTDKNSHQRCSIKKTVKILQFWLCWSLFWNEVAIKLIKKRFQHRNFSVNIAKFLPTTVLKNICLLLLLKIIIKSFLQKATGHNDHYMINTGGQRPKIGSKWPLIDPYLQRWVNAGVPLMGPFLVLHFSCCILMTFPMILCNIAIYADDTTFYSNCDQASDL